MALADGGRFMTGLSRDLAMEQAAAMVEGAVSMVLVGRSIMQSAGCASVKEGKNV